MVPGESKKRRKSDKSKVVSFFNHPVYKGLVMGMLTIFLGAGTVLLWTHWLETGQNTKDNAVQYQAMKEILKTQDRYGNELKMQTNDISNLKMKMNEHDIILKYTLKDVEKIKEFNILKSK